MNSDSTAGPGKRLPGFELFDDAMRLTKQHYADPVNEREALERTLERITLSLPPHCTEDAISFRDCSRSAQTCFKEVISQIAARCNIKTDRLVVRAVNIFMQSLDANSSLLDAEMLKELKIG
ncbi:MAG TPA: hypothetical protein VK463_10275, partial [Desulfomonilaceae bacterium]|nr:hypothetical protein [Desulfomonilaceae bacterium]